jgi:hypothetical protein
MIGSAHFVLPIAAFTDVSILAVRFDSDARGKPKRSRKGGDSCIMPFQLASFH